MTVEIVKWPGLPPHPRLLCGVLQPSPPVLMIGTDPQVLLQPLYRVLEICLQEPDENE